MIKILLDEHKRRIIKSLQLIQLYVEYVNIFVDNLIQAYGFNKFNKN